MNTITLYQCSQCQRVFGDRADCMLHEQQGCGAIDEQVMFGVELNQSWDRAFEEQERIDRGGGVPRGGRRGGVDPIVG